MVDVKSVTAKPVQVEVTSIRLPPHVPRVTAAQLDALIKRSGTAREIDQELRRHERSGRLVSGRDVEKMLGRAYKKDGKPKTEAAAVVAYYAQNKPRIFAKDAVPKIVEFVEKVDKEEWNRLVADLEAFIERLNQQRKEDERQAQLKKMRDKDDREYVQRTKIDPQKANGTKAERAAQQKKAAAIKEQQKRELQMASEADLNEDITNHGRLTLSEVEETKLKLLKKGFANS
jgi:hypothetical protein